MSTAQDEFHHSGFRIIRNLITRAEARTYAQALSDISGLPASTPTRFVEGHSKPFYRHGGAAAHQALWPLLAHDQIINAVSETLGAPAKCLPGIDTIGMHASETEPHRDASPSELPALVGAPYTLSYPVVRVILYPASPGERFGVLPGSHHQPGRCQTLIQQAPDAWQWITLRNGDAVLFDPRLVHAGPPSPTPNPWS